MATLQDYPEVYSGYRTNLPVSRMVHQISWIKVSLDIFSTKDEKSSEFYLQIKQILHFLVKDGCIVVNFYSILVYMRQF